MNADAFRQFFDYHLTENRKIWDTHIVPLSQADFVKPIEYSVGSVRNHAVHMMNVDKAWFSGLRGVDLPEFVDPATLEDRDTIRTQWDAVEREMRDYLATLSDDMLFSKPFTDEEDKHLVLWQVLLHIVNHGTDHRAQLLRILHDLGAKTGPQDYVWYIYDHI